MQFFHKIQDRHIELFLKICIVYGIILHIVPYFYNRSLWLDEATFVSSICTRSLSELVASPLDWGQSAPVGYLFIVKLITMVWNTSEAALRIFSLFSAFVCMYLIYALLKDKVAPKFALWTVTIFSVTNGFIYYGNEAKPYMSDNMFCLLVLYVWQKYRENKIELYKLCLIYAVVIWFSFSAVFFMGACMLIECVRQIRTHENVKKLLINGILCSIVLASLLVYYVFWLSSTSSNAGDAGYWALLRFPLIPTSIADIKLIVMMFREIWNFFPKSIAVLFMGMNLFYLFECVKYRVDRSKIFIPCVTAFLLLLITSSIGFYPIQDRLVQIIPIVALIIVSLFFDDVRKSGFAKRKGVLFVLHFLFWAILVYGCAYGSKSLSGSFVYKSGSEVAASFAYLNTNITDDDIIYVYRNAIPVYCYKTNYPVPFNSLRHPDQSFLFDKTIYGQNLRNKKNQIAYNNESEINENAVRQDADIILKYDSVYLFTSHRALGILNVIDILRQYGTVETVVDSYETRLYRFTRNKS